MEKIPFTEPGLETIKAELSHLKNTERQAVINAIAVAANMAICRKMLNIMLRVSANHLLKGAFPNWKM